MNISFAIVQFLGIIFAVIGLSVLVDRKNISGTLGEMVRNQGTLWIIGFITLIIGAVILVLNNVWTSGLPLVVTILGWLALIKGCYILIFPRSATAWYERWNKDWILMLGGLVAFILGVVFIWLGFM